MTLAEYGRSDRLDRVEPPTNASLAALAGDYVNGAAAPRASVDLDGEGEARLTVSGSLGEMIYALTPIGPDLWEGRATGATVVAADRGRRKRVQADQRPHAAISLRSGCVSAAYPTRGRAAYALCVLALLGFVLTTDMTLTALLIETMKRDMALTDVEVALLQGTAYGLALGLASIPMGRLIDRYSRRNLITVGIVGCTGALAAIGLTGSLATVMAARAVLGVVAALVVPAAFSLGADLYPAERRSMATSLLVVGQATGQDSACLPAARRSMSSPARRPCRSSCRPGACCT